MSSAGEHIIVIGAGIIGVSCALELLKAGFRVTIITKDSPGTGCSFGAAGNYGGNVHFAIPNIALKVPKMYFNRRHPFSFYPQDVWPLSNWFRGYVKASEPTAAQKIAGVFKELGSGIFETYTDWLKDARQAHLIKKQGRLFVWTTEAGYAADQYGLDFRKKQGIELQILSPEQTVELEPAAPRQIVKGAYAPDAGHIIDPLAVVEALAQEFVRGGGSIVREEARHIHEQSESVRIETSERSYTGDHVVLAMGIDSKALAETVGVSVPLVAERGYHVMFSDSQLRLKIPIMWEERKVAFTGMALGLRVAGIAQFTAKPRHAPARFARLLERTTQEFFPSMNREFASSTWSGYRPVTPDYLPVLGRNRAHGRIICAYGHGHSGYQLAPGTARIVRDLAINAPVPPNMLEMLSPNRF